MYQMCILFLNPVKCKTFWCSADCKSRTHKKLKVIIFKYFKTERSANTFVRKYDAYLHNEKKQLLLWVPNVIYV